MIEAIPQQVWTARPDGALDYVNVRTVEHFGRGFDELVAWGWTEMVHPDDLPKIIARWKTSLETGILYEAEFRVRRASDGAYLWILSRALPLRDAENRIVKWFGTNTDISERKQAEEKTRFQAHLLNSVGQAIIATDLQGVVIYWNHFAEVLYGWTSSEVIGRNIVDLNTPQASKQQANEIMARLRAGEGWSGEFLVQRRDGTTFPSLTMIQPVYDTAGVLDGIVGISTDISERKAVEEACSKAKRAKRLSWIPRSTASSR
jgi:PAS domain S-box-containing protein